MLRVTSSSLPLSPTLPSCSHGTHSQGSLVRAIRRLEELMRQLAEALRNIGELDLAAVCEAGREKIKRDIIFAASLYL